MPDQACPQLDWGSGMTILEISRSDEKSRAGLRARLSPAGTEAGPADFYRMQNPVLYIVVWNRSVGVLEYCKK